MSDGGAWFSLPTGRKLEDAPDRPAGRFGTLRPASDEIRTAFRRHGVREIPEDKIERHEGGRYWTDRETGEELELIRGFVDPAVPGESHCVAYAIRDNMVVPFKKRGDEGLVTSVVVGEMSGRPATGRDPMPIGLRNF